MLETRQAEQKKLRKTIKNTKTTIETLENEIKEKVVVNEPILKEYNKYFNMNKAILEDLSVYNSKIQQIEKAKKLKLSSKSYLNLQAGLMPYEE